MRPKPILLAFLILALATTGLSPAQDAAKPSALGGIELRTERMDVREALRSIFKQANVSYTLAPEVQGFVSADFQGLVIEDAVCVLARQVDAVVRIESGVYQVIRYEGSPHIVIFDEPVPGSKQALRSDPPVTFASADDKSLYFLRDGSLMKVDKATMKIVSTLQLGERRIRFSN